MSGDAEGCSRCRHCRRKARKPAQRLHTMAATLVIMVMTAAVGAGMVLVGASQPQPAMAVPHGQVFRDCPVADCSPYPDPAHIKGVALSSLENWLLFTRSAEAQIVAVRARHAKSWHGNAVRAIAAGQTRRPQRQPLVTRVLPCHPAHCHVRPAPAP
jgi:hypothetical protein